MQIEIMILCERVLCQKDKYHVCYAVTGTEYRSPAFTQRWHRKMHCGPSARLAETVDLELSG